MANGIGLKSLSAYSISKALHKSAVAQALIVIETYNATTLDRTSNHYAGILADWLDIRQVIENGLSNGILLNVKVPFLPENKIRSIRLTRQGLRVFTAASTNGQIRAAALITG
ncbi:MAG TPA: hypothetical protein VI753_06390 [Anaerolineales bacterium]|nr:hypothetical protein [Anaerolineales bacterium]